MAVLVTFDSDPHSGVGDGWRVVMWSTMMVMLSQTQRTFPMRLSEQRSRSLSLHVRPFYVDSTHFGGIGILLTVRVVLMLPSGSSHELAPGLLLSGPGLGPVPQGDFEPFLEDPPPPEVIPTEKRPLGQLLALEDPGVVVPDGAFSSPRSGMDLDFWMSCSYSEIRFGTMCCGTSLPKGCPTVAVVPMLLL